MRRLEKLLGFLTVLLLAAGFGVSVRASELPAVSEEHPLIGYPVEKFAEVTLYEDDCLTEEKLSVSYRKFSILKVDEDVLYVRCTVRGEETEGWTEAENFLTEDYEEKVQSYAIEKLRLVRSYNTDAKLKTIPKNTGGYTIGKRGKRYQVMFYQNKRYYLGWVSRDGYEEGIRQSMVTTGQRLADGLYTIKNKKANGEILTYDDGDLFMDENTGGEDQLFRLEYQKNGSYLIKTYREGYYLSLEDGEVTVGTEKTYWYFSRDGAYFTVEEEASGDFLAMSGDGMLKTAGYKDSGNFKWSFTKKKLSGTKNTITVFSQYDPKWAGTVYCKGKTVRTIATSGCGVMSYVNAIYALNGQFIEPAFLAKYSNSHGHYIYMSGTLETLYQAFARDYGSTYHFKWSGRTESLSVLKEHLLRGGTAVANVPGHYIAIAGYRKSDNTFLVLDSAVTSKRPTSITGDWVSAATLQTGTMGCYYFHLFSAE